MKLLIVTQAVDLDDPILGFFHRWIEEFARNVDHIEVICLKKGRHALPKNVTVHSLGKEKGKASSVVYAIRFLKLVWRLRHSYDAVFVHMNPEYVVLAGWLWRLLDKRMGLWYTHGTVSWYLRLAVWFAHWVFTASEESMLVRTPKKRVMGHGIDTDLFSAPPHQPHAELRIITVGRVSRTKQIGRMLASLDVLDKRYTSFMFSIVGAPATDEDKKYLEQLRTDIARRPYAQKVRLCGPLTQERLAPFLREHDVFLNLSTTNSLDKAVLEAFVSGLAVVTSNRAFHDILLPLGLYVEGNDAQQIADAFIRAKTADTTQLASWVRENHALPRLIERIHFAYTEKT